MTSTNCNGSPQQATAEPATAAVTDLVGGILGDAQRLFTQQAEMFKAEVRQDFQRSKRAAEFGAVAIVLATVGSLGLVNATAHLLHDQFQIDLWAAWGIVGGLFLLAGTACGFFAYSLLERFNPLPTKSIQALRENLSWQNK